VLLDFILQVGIVQNSNWFVNLKRIGKFKRVFYFKTGHGAKPSLSLNPAQPAPFFIFPLAT
jgi:hypothetical protein